ncbi:olfactory receptor 7G3-like, partial [Tachyglossus aculeatus]|uniref:olfactory receptor 7G3-like n=1 Tax=Tachyglossus aculeatus TaxID=9261 RepID=UPI0018F619D1
TPMYFFLTNLSLADVCLLSTTVPNMLVNIQTHSKSISYTGCLAQICFFILFVSLDHFILTGMAYDLYMAICHPLHYTTIMSPRLRALMVPGSWIISSLYALTHTLMVLRISFCADNKIHHFFCEPTQIIKLSCTDPLINEVVLFVLGALLGLGPLTGLLFSYNRIFSTILRIPSARGRYKTFSTCGSHLSVVSLFSGTGTGVYFGPRSPHTARKESITSVMYSVVTPMLNPFIYSLRNKDMKGALRKFLNRKSAFFQRSHINCSRSSPPQSSSPEGTEEVDGVCKAYCPTDLKTTCTGELQPSHYSDIGTTAYFKPTPRWKATGFGHPESGVCGLTLPMMARSWSGLPDGKWSHELRP